MSYSFEARFINRCVPNMSTSGATITTLFVYKHFFYPHFAILFSTDRKSEMKNSTIVSYISSALITLSYTITYFLGIDDDMIFPFRHWLWLPLSSIKSKQQNNCVCFSHVSRQNIGSYKQSVKTFKSLKSSIKRIWFLLCSLHQRLRRFIAS